MILHVAFGWLKLQGASQWKVSLLISVSWAADAHDELMRLYHHHLWPELNTGRGARRRTSLWIDWLMEAHLFLTAIASIIASIFQLQMAGIILLWSCCQNRMLDNFDKSQLGDILLQTYISKLCFFYCILGLLMFNMWWRIYWTCTVS